MICGFLSIVRILSSHMARAGDLSGFHLEFVGFHVGFLGLPDKHHPNEINCLGCVCRVCRVLSGEESSGEISDPKSTHAGSQKAEVGKRTLDDVQSRLASVLDSTWTPKRPLRRLCRL